MNLTANRLCLLVAAWLVLTANVPFWKLLFNSSPGSGSSWLFAFGMALWLLGITLVLVRGLSPGRIIKWSLSLLLLFGAATSWFMETYGVAIDSGMIRNVLQTNFQEARDFLGWPLLWRLIWQAALPIALLWRVHLPVSTWLGALRSYSLGVLAGVALLIGTTLPMYSSFVSFMRNQSVARYLVTPANVVLGSISLVRKARRASQPFVVVGADARRAAANAKPMARAKPLLVVFVLGETARAANFSLGGYARNTNPLLEQKEIYYFGKVRACGTATASAVPCLFSELPRSEFEPAVANHRDTVLDIIQRAGLAVQWIDNQSGCKGVCTRVPTMQASTYHPESCTDGECLDDALLFALDANLQGLKQDSLIVLHAMGSHGPSYHRRVPPEYELFKPICPTERIETCTDAQIVNSYDNSIAYTDYVLAGLIDRLAARQEQVDSVLLYVSDHGESLGENGLYLHGHPYVIAPDVQKDVPLLLWFSAGAKQRMNLDAACLREQMPREFSHDNVSHTLLGLAQVQTSIYRPGLDMLASCTQQQPTAVR
jgi:lipid A ethanolaminephosphotransferase